MKKLTTSLLMAVFSVILFSSAQAQFVKAGAGIMYGSEIEQIGIRADIMYQINEEFRAVADVGYFLPDEYGNTTFTWWEINANANYLFFVDEEQGLNAYAIGGLNFTTMKWDYDGETFGMIDGSSSETEVGLNIGVGGEYDLDFADLFGELKFVLSDADQLNIGVGLRIPLGGN